MKTYSTGFICLFLVFLLCQVRQSLYGEVVFDNFGPNDSYNASSGRSINWVVFSPGSSGNMGLGSAARFQVGGGSYTLSSVTLAMGRILGTNNLAISIRADNGGLPTGSLLETVVMHPTDLIVDNLVVTYPSSLAPVMAGGDSFWLVVEPVDLNQLNDANNAAFSWYWSGTQGYVGNRQFNVAAGDWYDWQIFPNSLVPTFRIEGTLVPEPGTLALALAGAAGFIGMRWAWRFRRKQS